MTEWPVLVIEVRKLVDYLLDPHHPVGGGKAKFFIDRGFDRLNPEPLASALAGHAIAGWPGRVTSWPGAMRHQIDGPLILPDGDTSEIRSVWERKQGTEEARLITAFPI